MKILYVPSEPGAKILEGLVKPGIEVCCNGQDIDSKDITEVIMLTGYQLPAILMQTAEELRKKVEGKTSKEGVTLTIILV